MVKCFIEIRKSDLNKKLIEKGKDVFEYSIFGDPTGQTKIGDFSC